MRGDLDGVDIGGDMNQLAMNFEAYPSNPYRYGCNVYRLYERLKTGITNHEMVREISPTVHNRRHEIRVYLEGSGWYLPTAKRLNNDGLRYWIFKREGAY